jgi:hypothetical protein
MRGLTWFGALILFAVMSTSASAQGPDPKTTLQEEIEFLRWSADSDHYLLRVTNANLGGAAVLKIIITETGEVLHQGKKPMVFVVNSKDEEDKMVKRLIKQHNLTQEPVVEAVHPRRDHIMVMTGQKKDKFLIIGLNEDRATRYESIDVMRDEKGKLSEVFQRQLVWDAEGRYLAVVYHTELKGESFFSGDFVHVTRFRPGRIKAPGED